MTDSFQDAGLVFALFSCVDKFLIGMINTNGGFMKQYSGNKKQWLLCASLIMALGSQSYFQVASNKISSIELASLDRSPQAVTELSADKEKKLDDILKKIEISYLEKHKSDKTKTDNQKLFEFYKSYEQTRLAEAKTENDTDKKSLKLAQAKNFKTKADKLSILIAAEKTVKIKPVDVTIAKIEVTKPKTETDKVKTEGNASPAQVCDGGCTPSDENIAAALKVLQAAKKIEIIEDVATAAKTEEKTEAPAEAIVETAKERRERLADERQAAKELKEEAKRIKAEEIADKKREKLEELQAKKQEAKEIRNEKFTDTAAAITEKCKDEGIECSASELTSLLSNYTDDKKIDSAVVSKVFNQVLAKDLRAALRNPEDSQVAAQALFTIQSETPAEYRFLKIKTIDITRNEAISRALEVTRNFKMADQLTTAKRPLEAIQYINAGNAAAGAFDYSSRTITGSITSGLESAEDKTTMDYVNRVYMPDMQKIMTNLTNPLAAEISKPDSAPITETSSTISTSSTSPAVSTRNSRSSDAAAVTVENKPNILQQNGVQFGTPSASPRGDRRSN